MQKSSYYYIELQIVEAYSYDFDINKEPSEGLLDDVTFQYDLNYSSMPLATCHLALFTRPLI
ncbi:hypothetical protein [Spiroplasma endosymbiont of Acasis viretata]|uniref:hypothetical protein n=1 Tax=Spiroplasma endosymbiont of Acasis viretata TaxID=3066306 RepID=UPI00313F208A